MSIDARSAPYVLAGRVVTMTAADVIDEGRIYIKGGEIVAVTTASATPPTGFNSAPVVKVGGTIFPGLIELHNHLSYNAIPLWDVPKAYAHSGSWQGTDEYKAAITKPAQVLANTAGNVEALVRFVECRCLLGGVTTSQGLTLSSKQGIQSAYKGLVRNVESPERDDLPAAGAKIGEPDRDPDVYFNKISKKACYLQHLSEGLGDTPRKQFTRLQRPDGSWALHPSFCGIHSTALTPEDFAVLAGPEHQGSIVWSPLSNLLLYGDTTDVASAKAAGVPIALGSDWGPSGTKNLLGELKVAWLVSEEQGGLFSLRELCEMVTTTPAAILGWADRLGSIEPGKLADLVVLDDTVDDPYRQLVNARETSITLVVIGGIPRAGQSRMMKRFRDQTETIKVGRSSRVLNLTARDPADDPLGGISLTTATDRLRDTLARLPEFAERLDAALGAGWVPGAATGSDAGSAFGEAALPEDWTVPLQTVVLDFEASDVARDPSFALGSGNLVDWVDPMQLEGITVADDPTVFRKLASAGNLPAYVKTGLPRLYGERVPVLDLLDASEETFDPSLHASRELHALRADVSDDVPLRQEERLRIIDQAVAVLERYYVHLPMKRAMHAVDPVQRLRVLRFETERRDDGTGSGSDFDFHLQIAEILHSVRDLHTAYRLPFPYRRQVAWLPYLIEECEDGGGSRFIVSKVVGPTGPETFTVGVEVLHWNGAPIERVVEQLARQMPGGNAAARRARAISTLTVRPLVHGLVPVEDWVVLGYRADDSRTREFQQPWLVFQPSRRMQVLSLDDEGPISTVGIDDQSDEVQRAKTLVYAASMARVEATTTRGARAPVPPATDDNNLPSTMPTHFRARRVATEGQSRAAYGYVRIFSFNTDAAERFIDEFARLLSKLPQAGLILDVRGNGGGLIQAAEGLLELISPRVIEPERAQFINSPANIELCERHAPSDEFDGFSLAPWIESMRRSVATGATYSHGFPLTDPASCNRRGQRYQGPVVLIVDGLCYSATDMFAAGFQDHDLGMVLGVDARTGAGGANVWSHALLRRLAGRDAGLRRLPRGADLRVAIRRTQRVGPNAGEVLEDLGVRPQAPYRMTRDDLLHGNRDLIQAAIKMLEKQTRYRLTVKQHSDGLAIRATHVDWLEGSVAGRRVRSRDVEAGRALITRSELPAQGPYVVDVVGMVGEAPKVRARVEVTAAGLRG